MSKVRHFGHGTTDTGTPTPLSPLAGALHHLLLGGRRRRLFGRLVAASAARPGDRVLDVGCGTGPFTRAMATAVSPNGTALGIDASAEAIGTARRRTRLVNCHFAEGSAEAINAPDGAYDVVVSSLMLHHIPEAARQKAIEEMFRVLRPGGRTVIAEFSPPTSLIGRQVVGPILSPAMRDNPVHLLEPLARSAGFQQVQVGRLRPWTVYIQAVKPATP